MLEFVKSARLTDTNIVSVSVGKGRRTGQTSEFLQWSVATRAELLALDAHAARLQEHIATYERFLVPRNLDVVDPSRETYPHVPLVVDPAFFYVLNAEGEQQSTQGLVQMRLKSALLSSFEADPLEDGMYHPAEEIIAEALWSEEDQHVLGWLNALCLDASHPSFAASVLRCLGRQTSPGTGSWRAELVRSGLATNDVEIRDAAAQAAESWMDSHLVDVLESHSEPVTWLRYYIRGIIDDLRP